VHAEAEPRRLRIAKTIGRPALARRAFVLFAVTSSATCIAIAFAAMFGSFVIRDPNASSAPRFWATSTEVVGGATAVVALAFVIGFWRTGRVSVPWTRHATDDVEVSARVKEVVAELSLAAGVSEPSVTIIDKDVVNTTILGSGRGTRIVLTTGACALPNDELSALIAFDVAIMRSPELRSVLSARSSLGLVAAMVKVLWALLAGSFIVLCATGQAVPWGVGLVVGALGILVLMPLGAVAAASAVTLAIAANMMADRDAVAMTFQPDVYLDVLLAVLTDDRSTDSKLSPLGWFERTTVGNDFAAFIGAALSRTELIHRVEQMAAIAALPLPERWPPVSRQHLGAAPPPRRRRSRQTRTPPRHT
jgi:hypothetical protein